jgi:hypothetical protein
MILQGGLSISNFLANTHRAYFIKSKACMYTVASRGYTRINVREKKTNTSQQRTEKAIMILGGTRTHLMR